MARNEEEQNADKVYFRFEEGIPPDGLEGLEGATVSLPRTVLESIPDSLLAKLAEKRWKSNEDKMKGSSPEHPIITRPLKSPCQEEWSPKLIDMILETYYWKAYQIKKAGTMNQEREENQEENREGEEENGVNGDASNSDRHGNEPPPKPSLPRGIDLEEAMSVLDFYGLSLDARKNVNFNKLPKGELARNSLFLKDLEQMDKAFHFILDDMINNPEHEKLYLFTPRKEDPSDENPYDVMHYFTKGSKPPCEFTNVGNSDEEFQCHYTCAQHAYLRRYLVGKLKDELMPYEPCVEFERICFSRHNETTILQPERERETMTAWKKKFERQLWDVVLDERMVLHVTLPYWKKRKRKPLSVEDASVENNDNSLLDSFSP